MDFLEKVEEAIVAAMKKEPAACNRSGHSEPKLTVILNLYL